MSRLPRLHQPGGIYHATLRGNHQRPIFFTDGDRRRFSDLVAEAGEHYQLRVHAYCWMTNHVHLAVQVGDVPLGEGMRMIASRYARRVHRRLDVVGHLFERRYRANLVTTDAYLLELIRYIHLNPVRAGMSPDPGAYPWSSHRAYAGSENVPWLTRSMVLGLFSADPSEARGAYLDFLRLATPDEVLTEFRSRSRCVPAPMGLAVMPRQHGVTLEQLTEAACRSYGVDPEQLAKAGKHRGAATVRAVVTAQARAQGVATLAELARHFNRRAATLLQCCQRHQRELQRRA